MLNVLGVGGRVTQEGGRVTQEGDRLTLNYCRNRKVKPYFRAVHSLHGYCSFTHVSRCFSLLKSTNNTAHK